MGIPTADIWENDNTITNFEGDIVEYEISTDYAMEISDENDMFQKCSVSIKNIDEHINSTINIVYAYDPISLHKKWNSKFDKDFANDLRLRGEIYKMSASIGSYNVSIEDCGIFQSLSVTTIANLE